MPPGVGTDAPSITDSGVGDLLRRLSQPGEGFSVSISSMSDAKSGWAISRNGKGIKMPANQMFDKDGNPTQEGRELLLAYLLKNKEDFLSPDKPNQRIVLGGWHSEEDGMLYFDVTDVYSKDSMTADEAIAEGKKQNQIAIADLDEITAAIENNDWEKRKTILDSGGDGSETIPLSDLEPILRQIRGKPPQRPERGEMKTEKAPDGVLMIMADPVKELAEYHRDQRDWSKVRALPKEERDEIADLYDEAEDLPVSQVSEETKQAFEALAREVEEQFKILTDELGIKVEFTDDDPYENFEEMYKDFVQNKRLKILKTESTGGHPIFTNEQNDMFRAVHDAFGHLATGRGFDRHGEEAAYQAHKSMFGPEAVKAAATELRGQNAFLISRGFFGPQKIMLLPERMRKMLLTLMAYKVLARDNSAQESNDLDNAFDTTKSHHVSCGRSLARKKK